MAEEFGVVYLMNGQSPPWALSGPGSKVKKAAVKAKPATNAPPAQAVTVVPAPPASPASSSSAASAVGAGTTTVAATDLDSADKELQGAVGSGKSRYVLTEYRDGKPYQSLSLPSIPSAKSIRLNPATEVRYTLEDMPIREHTSSRSWSLSFRGMTGISGAGLNGFGMKSLLAFDKFIHQYQTDAYYEGSLYLNNNKQRVVRDRTWLELRDLEDGFGWRVEIRGWDWDRNAQTRVMNAEWALSLQGYSFIQNVPARGGVDFRNVPKINEQALRDQASALTTAEQTVAAASAAAAKSIKGGADVYKLSPGKAFPKPWIIQKFEKLFALIKRVAMPVGAIASKVFQVFKDIENNVNAFKDLINTAVGTIRGAVNKWTDFVNNLISLPRQLLNSFVAVTQEIRRGLRAALTLAGSVWSLTQKETWEAVWVEMKDAVLSIGDIGSAFTEALGKSGGKVSNTAAPVSTTQAGFTVPSFAEDSKYGSCVPYVVNPGDTLEAIALILYGDSSQWSEIANFNKMQGNMVGPDGSPIAAGSVILLPYSTLSGVAVPQAQAKGDLYGTDWAIDPTTGDRVINTKPYTTYNGVNYVNSAPKGSDYGTISGSANLIQAVANRAQTVVGSLTVAPEYGVLPFPVGTQLTTYAIASAMVSVQSGMTRDPRVFRVQRLKPTKKADKLTLDFQVVPVTGGAVGVVTPLGI